MQVSNVQKSISTENESILLDVAERAFGDVLLVGNVTSSELLLKNPKVKAVASYKNLDVVPTGSRYDWVIVTISISPTPNQLADYLKLRNNALSVLKKGGVLSITNDQYFENLAMYNYSYLSKKCHQKRIEIVSEYIKRYAPSVPRILSIGCGNGEVESRLEGDVCGLDIHLVDHAPIDITQGSVEDIPFPSESFDVVFLGELIEHLYDIHSAMKEIRRVLRKGGILVLTTPNVINFRDRVRSLFGILPKHLGGYLYENRFLFEHIRLFNKKSLLLFLKQQGFDVLEITSSAININIFGDTIIDFYKIARYLPELGNNLICAAKVRKV